MITCVTFSPGVALSISSNFQSRLQRSAVEFLHHTLSSSPDKAPQIWAGFCRAVWWLQLQKNGKAITAGRLGWKPVPSKNEKTRPFFPFFLSASSCSKQSHFSFLLILTRINMLTDSAFSLWMDEEDSSEANSNWKELWAVDGWPTSRNSASLAAHLLLTPREQWEPAMHGGPWLLLDAFFHNQKQSWHVRQKLTSLSFETAFHIRLKLNILG